MRPLGPEEKFSRYVDLGKNLIRAGTGGNYLPSCDHFIRKNTVGTYVTSSVMKPPTNIPNKLAVQKTNP